MDGLSRRQFLETAGGVAGGALALAPASRASTPAPALTISFANYVRFLPLAAGDVRPADLALTCVRGDRSEMLRRATSDPAVDGGEASMAQHVLRLDRGDRSLVAIPVFLLRNFTARDLYTRKGSTITVSGLTGRRVGIYNWAASGAVWYRHLVRFFGQDPASIAWVVGSPDSTAPVTMLVPPPANVTLAREGKSLSDLLLAGEIDAFFAPLPPRAHHAIDGPIVRVVTDYRAVEQRYYEQTRCYPPQHVLVLRRPVWEKDPSVGRRLVDVFDRCESAFQAAQRLFPYGTPWQVTDVEDTERLMGLDYHAHGLEKNRHAVDVFCRSAFEDGLTKRRLTVEDFFAEFLAA